MKQVVYTCARCGRQEAVDPFPDVVPMEWAAIEYKRLHVVQEGDQKLTASTTCTTHACGDCAKVVLDYIEGGASNKTGDREQPLMSHLSELMRINSQMFDSSIRVLAEQNMSLHEQVKDLAAANAGLCKELEASRRATT